MVSLIQSIYWRRYSLVDLKTGVGFSEGVETLLSTTELITVDYCVKQVKKLDKHSMFKRQERGWWNIRLFASNLNL
jgi:hypothetical protein